MISKVLHRVKDRNIVHRVKRRNATWIGHNWRRNCLLKHVIEGKIEGRMEVTRVRGRRCKQLKKTGGYLKLKEEALDLTVLGNGFGIVSGLVKRQTT